MEMARRNPLAYAVVDTPPAITDASEPLSRSRAKRMTEHLS